MKNKKINTMKKKKSVYIYIYITIKVNEQCPRLARQSPVTYKKVKTDLVKI